MADDPKAAPNAKPKRPKAPKKAAAPLPAVKTDDRFRLAFWEKPQDLDLLRVWADSLSEQGDPRGEFIQLSTLTSSSPEQDAKREALKKKLGGKLVGPARPFLRTWQFGEEGLVTNITCEAPLFIEGFEEIAALHPKLLAHVTAVRKKSVIADLAKLALHRIYFLTLEWSGITDETLIELGPALKGVKNLSLSYNLITAKGLRAIAPYVADLEYLALGTALKQRELGDAIGNGWVDALCDTPAFHNLRAVNLFNYANNPAPAQLERLKRLPKMKSVTVGSPRYYLKEVEQQKAGAP